MKPKSAKKLIIEQLKVKSCAKQDVFQTTSSFFELFKEVLSEITEELKLEMSKTDNRIEIAYRSPSKYEAELKFAGDVLIFHMHSNVFTFDKTHPIWRSSYIKNNELLAYCGIINVYNFLADSLKYNRINDSGYLIARLFVNKDDHFFVEGKRQLGYLYNDFMNSTLNKKTIRSIVESAILYTIDFDLLTPPYSNMKEITVHEINEITSEMKIKTGKRLGFKFEADNDSI